LAESFGSTRVALDCRQRAAAPKMKECPFRICPA
jgi:hypothetical protein